MKNLILIAVTLFVSISSYAATIEVTLPQAIDLALKNNPSIKIANSEINIDKAKKMQIKAMFYPKISSVSKYFNTNHLPSMYHLGGVNMPVFDNTGEMTGDHLTFHPMAPYPNKVGMAYRTDINLMFPLYTGGKRHNAIKSIDKMHNANQSNLNEKKSLLTYNVKKVFSNILFLNKVIDVYEEALSQYNKHLELAKVAYKQGVRSELDILKFQSKIEEFKSKIIDLKGKREIAGIGLANLLNLPATDHLICIADKKDIITENITEDYSQKMNDILSNNWKIKMLQNKIAALNFKKKINSSKKLPTIFAFGNYNLTHNMDFTPFDETWHGSYAVGLGLKVDIFDGNKSKGETAETNATIGKLKYSKEGLSLKLRMDLEKSLAKIKSLLAEKKALEKNLIVAQKALSIVTVGFDNGVNTNIELNDAALKIIKVKTLIAKTDKDINIEKANIVYLSGGFGN